MLARGSTQLKKKGFQIRFTAPSSFSPPFSNWVSGADILPLLSPPTEYDYSKPSVDIYGRDHKELFGYERSKSRLDYQHHKNYSEPRQLLHNAIVQHHFSLQSKRFHNPWLVFTAGAMGSGKTFIVKALSDNGYFPLTNFIRISQDRMKRLIPEYHGYLHCHPETVGNMLRQEVGYISEVLLWESLFEQMCIWVDGSLRHLEFHEKLFSTIQEDFPNYRIAVIYVKSSEQRAFERSLERSKTTQRIVPEEQILKSLQQVPKTMRLLRPLTDFYCEIDNDEDGFDSSALPKIQYTTWDAFRETWNCKQIDSEELQEPSP